MSTSACRKSSRNWLPIPFPSCAPGTKPATSIISTGMKRLPLLHEPTRGMHCLLNSLSTQSILTKPTPVLGLMVVKGYGAMAASAKVAALKKVLFPTLGLQTTPTNIKKKEKEVVFKVCSLFFVRCFFLFFVYA